MSERLLDSERNRACYVAHQEAVKSRVRTYRTLHAEQIDAYRAANRDQRNAQRRAWGRANAERLRESNATRDPEAQRAAARAYYAAHAEEERRKSQEWRAAHPDELREQQRRYRIANAGKVLDKNAKRRARLKGALHEVVDRRLVHEGHSGLCGICRQPVSFEAMTLDHIHPLIAGGSHTYANLQPAHRSCNSRKGARVQLEKGP